MRKLVPVVAILLLASGAYADEAADAPATADPPADSGPGEPPAPVETPAPEEAPALGDGPARLPRFAAPRMAPRNRLVVNDLMILRNNPIGVENQLRAGYQRRLFDSDAPISRDNFLFVGTLPKLNPAYVRAGPAVEVQPLSIVNLRAGVEQVRFFSTFGFLQSFGTPRADYSDSALEKLADAGAHYGASGVHAFFEPTFQIKVGNVAVRNKLSVDYWDIKLRDGDTVFYESTFDTLLPDEGMNVGNDFDVLYLTDFGLTAGIRHTYVRPIYEPRHFAAGEGTAFHRNRHHRLGLLLAYTFYERGYARFDRPSLVLITSWYLSHRWRTGEDVSAAVPYTVLAFAFQSDVLDF